MVRRRFPSTQAAVSVSIVLHAPTIPHNVIHRVSTLNSPNPKGIRLYNEYVDDGYFGDQHTRCVGGDARPKCNSSKRARAHRFENKFRKFCSINVFFFFSPCKRFVRMKCLSTHGVECSRWFTVLWAPVRIRWDSFGYPQPNIINARRHDKDGGGFANDFANASLRCRVAVAFDLSSDRRSRDVGIVRVFTDHAGNVTKEKKKKRKKERNANKNDSFRKSLRSVGFTFLSRSNPLRGPLMRPIPDGLLTRIIPGA